MIHHVAFLGAAALALSGVIAAKSAAPVQVNDAAVVSDTLPRALSEFGFFSDFAEHNPVEGVVPYSLNTPLFSDGADKLRFVYIPDGGTAVARNDNEVLQFPVGSALIKTFAFGEGENRRLIETRVLLHRADGWLALPYRWNGEQTEATLALAGGRTALTTPTGESISYRIPNKNQCKECHGLEGEVVPIGPKARNLSHDWLNGFVKRGLLDAVPANADRMPDWSAPSTAGAEAAARAYLDVNCAHCHRPGATASNSGLDLRWEQDDPVKLGIMKRPVAAGRGSGGHDFDILPGKPRKSILLHRMKSTDPGVAMPELGRATIDPEGIAAIERWIVELGM